MDKTKLIDMLKGLGLDPEVEDALVSHVENREMSDELLESVATALEFQAEGADVVRDQLIAEAEALEDMTVDLKASGDEYEANMEGVLDGFLNKVGEIGKQIQEAPAAPSAQPPQMPSVQEMQQEAAAPTLSPAAAPVTPVTPEPINLTPTPAPLQQMPQQLQSPFGQSQQPQ